MVVKARGMALSAEMAEMSYEADYYFHVKSKEDAVALVTHMPQNDGGVTLDALNAYAGPVIEQSINQIVQVTPLERVNEKIQVITQLVHDHLQDFLRVFGITVDTVKVLVMPKERADAQAHLAQGIRSHGTAGGPVLHGHVDGGARRRFGTKHGDRSAVSYWRRAADTRGRALHRRHGAAHHAYAPRFQQRRRRRAARPTPTPRSRVPIPSGEKP